MKRFGIAIAALPLLTACLSHPPPPPAPYHALGTEPFWNLIIDDKNVTLIRPDEQPVVQPRPQPIIGIAGDIYQTPRINVNIVHSPGCSDGMSDRVYPDRVQVTVDGTRYDGCGGL